MRKWSFRILGFTVNVQMGFLALLGVYLLFQLQNQEPLTGILSWAVVVFVSILVHELGHALVARRFGLRVGTIEIHGLGGHVTHARTTAQRQLAISLAGPFAGLTLGGLTALFAVAVANTVPQALGLLTTVIEQLLWVNIVWSIVNLLPMFPLDGGHALKSALSLVTSEDNAWKVTAGLGFLLGAFAVYLGFTSYGIFVLFIGGMVAWQNLQILQKFRAA